MDNIQAQNLLSRNKSVFQYDEDMLQAIDTAIEALKEDRKASGNLYLWG